MPITERTIQVDEQPVHFWEMGAHRSRKIILLHGDVGDAYSHWHNLIDHLGTEYHLVAPDLPGYNGTAALSSMTLDTLLDWIKAFADALAFRDTVVIGSSIGAMLARLYGARYQSLVPAVVMINGGTNLGKLPVYIRSLAGVPVVGGLMCRMQARRMVSRNALAQWLVSDPEKLSDGFAGVAKSNADGLAGVLRVMAAAQIPEKNIPLMPTLLLWGEDDPTAPLAEAEAIAREIPGAQLMPISRTGHSPHIEEPEVFTYQIEQYLDQISRPPSDRLPGAGKLPPLP